MILSVRSIRKSFGANEVLKDVSFVLREGEKAAVVGANGAGKTTLLKIIAGELPADAGEAAVAKGAAAGFLSQMSALDENRTIEEELLTVFEPLLKAEKEAARLGCAMGGLSGAALDAAMERYDALSLEFERLGGYEYSSRVRGVIAGLGFKSEELALPVGKLSGGQKTRVSLGKLLLSSPDLLLLDEPTNHLDADAISWLEDVFLSGYPGAVIVVSHDRYFLDKVAGRIIDISGGKSTAYNGNYTYFAAKKEEDRAAAFKRYADQQKEITRQETAIKLLRSFNREKSVRRAESREKLLNKTARLEKPAAEPEHIRIEFEPRLTSGEDVLALKNVSKSFGSRELFRNVSFELKRGDIAAIVGPNGVGKTTLMNMIRKGAPGIKLGENVKIGWFDQEYASLLKTASMFDEVSNAFPKLTNYEIRSTLAAFGFTGDDVFQTVGSLSGGEKGRVLLAKLMLSNANFLLLDEPTNHLDIYSREILEEALRGYAGTALYVSHDRYFINNTAETVIELSPEGASAYLGSYDDYAQKRTPRGGRSPEPRPQSGAALDRAQKRAEAAEMRKKESRLKSLEDSIAKAEARLAGLDMELIKPEVYTDYIESGRLMEEKKDTEAWLEGMYSEWERLSAEPWD